MLVVNWCEHSQQSIPWPEVDDYWVLAPMAAENVCAIVEPRFVKWVPVPMN